MFESPKYASAKNNKNLENINSVGHLFQAKNGSRMMQQTTFQFYAKFLFVFNNVEDTSSLEFTKVVAQTCSIGEMF